MDLKTRGLAPSPPERESIESVLGPADGDVGRDRVGGGSLRARRHLLLPTLHAVNDRIGWISPAAIDHIAERLDVSPAEIYGVVTFYGLFSTEERPERQVHACVDLVCRSRGVSEDRLPDGVHPSPCLGMCEQAPAALVTEAGEPARRVSLGNVSVDRLGDSPPCRRPGSPIPQAGDPDLVLLARAGRIEPLDFDAWVADGGLDALARAREIGPDAVIDLVDAAGLLGRGGAAFPTATKWRAVRNQAATPRHLVCNADESEPGTFKDRVLIENDPFALLEVDDDRRARRGLRPRLDLPARRVPGRRGHAGVGDRDVPARGDPRRRVRHHAAARCGCLHLRRGDGDLQLDRGVPRRAAEQAALPVRGGPVRTADRGQQRRDADERAVDRPRPGDVEPAAVLPVGGDRTTGRVRGRTGTDPRRADRPRRRAPGGFGTPGRAARRCRRSVRVAPARSTWSSTTSRSARRVCRSAPVW